MDAKKGSIYENLNGKKQFILPNYQRFYSWEKSQCERLWDDIVDMQEKGRESHFIGSIVSISIPTTPAGVQKFTLIDGQQRMITLTLLIIALRDYAAKNPDDKTVNEEMIEYELLKNKYANDLDCYKLVLTEQDRDILLKLIDKIPQKTGTHSRLLDNYEFFAGKIAKKELEPAKIFEAIGKLQIVNIVLDQNVDDAQAIFESLNSTGKALSKTDLIRNYILMGLKLDDQKEIYKKFWRPMEELFTFGKNDSVAVMENFFRDYLTMKLERIPVEREVYEEFKSYYVKSDEFDNVSELCEDLYKFAGYYTEIAFRRTTNNSLKSLYGDIHDLRMEVSFPFLLKVRDDFAKGVITEGDFIEILKLCISYVLRRSVCEIPTNSMNKTFATFKKSIKCENYVESIKAFFTTLDSYKEFPSDEKFTEAFVSRDIFHMRNRNFILNSLENYENKNVVDTGKLTREHIMPQNSNLSEEWRKELGENWREIQKKYLHTIGNLTLTAYNSEMSDRPFMEKMEMKGGFKESALRINASLVKLTEWNEEQIKKRAEEMVKKAVKIWKYPNISREELEKYQPTENISENYSLDSYDAGEKALELFELLDRNIKNLSPDVKCEFKKLYVAYKLETNFTDVVILKQKLKILVNMKFSDVIDPNGICRDVTNVGTWGNGDVEIQMSSASEINQIMEIIEQSFRKQLDE